MSAQQFSKYIQKRLIPRILQKKSEAIRRILNTRINTIRFTEQNITDMMQMYAWTRETAELAFKIILQEAETYPNIVKETDPNITKGNPHVYRPVTKKGTRIKQQYGEIRKFKTHLGNVFAKNKRLEAAQNFGSDFHAGHGASSFSVVHYLGLEAGRDIKKYAGGDSQAYKDYITGLQNLFDEQEVKNAHNIDVDAKIKEVYGAGRTYKRNYVVYLDLQVAEENLDDATKFEQGFDKELAKLLNEVAEKWPGSKPMMTLISDDILAAARGQKLSGSSKKTEKTPKINISKGKASTKTIKKGRATKLRTAKGQFTSPIALMNLINARLHDMIRKNMGSPALNYQTGRFARSVKITNISQTRQQQMTAFYTYMKSPYQTFERGYAQGSPQRDPRTLISKCIRDAAAQIMGTKFDIRSRRQ